MPDYPQTLVDFQRRFADDAACAHYPAALRWPEGFCFPAGGHDEAWALMSKPWTYECHGCRHRVQLPPKRPNQGAFRRVGKLPGNAMRFRMSHR